VALRIGYWAGLGQMAWDPSSDIPLRGSHAPRVGAGESHAEAATCRVESASAPAGLPCRRTWSKGFRRQRAIMVD